MSFINKFNEVANDYDSERKKLIPCFDDFYGIAIDVLDFDEDDPKVLDLGGGTGLLSCYLLEKYPNAKITLVDLADNMLNVARERFKDNPNISYVKGDYLTYEFNQKYDIIMSSLSIHHIPELAKKELYDKCVNLLFEGGIFINADQFLDPNPIVEKLFSYKFDEKVSQSELSKEAISKANERRIFDNPSSLDFQLSCLSDSGCRHVGVPYKYYNFAVLYGKK